MKIRRYECQDCGSHNIDWARCSIEDCDEPAFARGWCKKHYTRWYRYGDPETPDQRGRKPEDDTLLDDDSFWERVDTTTQQRMASRAR